MRKKITTMRDMEQDFDKIIQLPELQPYIHEELVSPKNIEFYDMNEDEVNLVKKGTRGELKNILMISVGLVVLLVILLWLGSICSSSTGLKGSLFLIGFFVIVEALLIMNYFSLHKQPVGARKGQVVYKRIFKSVSGFGEDRRVRTFYQIFVWIQETNQLVLAVETYKDNYKVLEINSPVLIAKLGENNIKCFPIR